LTVTDKAPRQQHASQWARTRERGSYTAMRLLVWLYRYGGNLLLSPVLYCVVSYFFVSRKATRHYSRLYLQRAMGGRVTRWDLWRHQMAFARALMYRIRAWMGKVPEADVDFPRRDQLRAMKRGGQGVLFLGAHLGNLDMFRAMVKPGESFVLNIIVHTRHAKKFNRLLHQINPQARVNLLQVDQITPETAMLLRSKLDDGEAVVLLADRVPSGTESRHYTADFLGSRARFPLGPFWLAILLKVPVFFMTSVYTGSGYQVIVEPLLEDSPPVSRRERERAARELFDAYIAELEQLCRRYPLQWFNFYDFWLDDTDNDNRYRQ
jgi:predicted LPLAT superfamily acyltransferase